MKLPNLRQALFHEFFNREWLFALLGAMHSSIIMRGQASAIAAGRFHANALQVAKRPHPGQHLPIALRVQPTAKSRGLRVGGSLDDREIKFRVKTDRGDAINLAKLHRAGDQRAQSV
jgi:hypothetical protein